MNRFWSVKPFSNQLETAVAHYILPIGWIALLTGMFWVGDRGAYPRVFYWLLAAPTLLVLLMKPREVCRHVLIEPIVMTSALFGLYLVASIGWSSTDNDFFYLAKRPIYILLLLASAVILAKEAPYRLSQVLIWSSRIGTVAASVTLIIFLNEGATGRLPGYGALFNPLLSAHVFGFFWVLWLARWINEGRMMAIFPILSISIIGAVIVATGSRTPLMAMAAVLVWVACTSKHKFNLKAVAAVASGTAAVALFAGEELMQRGLSYRPQIWLHVWHSVVQEPWLGHGFDAKLEVLLPGWSFALSDPHNIPLAVLYYSGAIGLTFWILLYGFAFNIAWRKRHDPLIKIGSALLVYGLVASMTEGGSFISRPKEHWFLIWIPFALLVAGKIIINKQSQVPPETAPVRSDPP